MYTGKDAYALRGQTTAATTHSTQIVLNLAEQYLKSGRIITTDNYYTSVALGNRLLENQTHLIGILRKNRAGNPKNIVEADLNKDENEGQKNQDGVVVAKWKTKRDVLMLTTKHDLMWLIQEEKTVIMKKL